MRPARTALLLVVSVLSGCSRPADRQGMLSAEELLARPAGWESPGRIKVWAAERSRGLGTYYVLVEAPELRPVDPNRTAVRIFLLKGRAELRVGSRVAAAGPSSYASAGPGESWSVRRLGKEPLLLALLATPDLAEPAQLLGLGSDRVGR